jgi:hypothetical protein
MSNGPGDDKLKLPTYAEHEPSLRDRVQQLVEEAKNDGDELPITTYPQDRQTYDKRSTDYSLYERRRLIVKMYFDAIKSKNDEVVALLIESELVTTATTNEAQHTPLLAAIEAGNIRTVQQLMDFDADVNAFGSAVHQPLRDYWTRLDTTYRTPLQSAAEKGNLTIVKLLIETYQADDSLIALDGQHALRLAAANGHKEIVAYLPSRRGGGWRRWKTKHSKAMRRVKRATRSIYNFCKVLLWYVPTFFLWDVPRDLIVTPTIRGVKWLKDHHKEVPGIVAAWLKKIPKKVWHVLKKIPVTIKDILQNTWLFIKAIPKAGRIALLWMWGGLKKLGTAVTHVFRRIFSLLHTVFVAITSFFRDCTFKDIVDGFQFLLHAIFVDAPQKLWKWLSKFGNISYKFLKALFGNLGCILWWLGRGIVEVFMYVPKRLATILVAFVQSLGGACKEAMIWINPKRV